MTSVSVSTSAQRLLQRDGGPIVKFSCNGNLVQGKAVHLDSGAKTSNGSRTRALLGLALEDGNNGQERFVQLAGVVDPSIAQLGAGIACAVGVDASGNPVRATDAACVSAPNWLGDCDEEGTITLKPRSASFVSPEDYGAKGNGIDDDSAALAAAISSVSSDINDPYTAPGGEVRLAPGAIYLCSAPLVWDTRGNVAVRGHHSRILCALTDNTDFLVLKGCARWLFEGVDFLYNSPSFSGRLVRLTHTGRLGNDVSRIDFHRCAFYGYPPVDHGNVNCGALLSMDGVTTSRISDSSFRFAKVGIEGQAPAFVNQVAISGCNFSRLVEASIKNPGEAWYIENNDFEPLEYVSVNNALVSPQASAIVQDLTYWCRGLHISGNWIGDGGAVDSRPWIKVQGFGINIEGNLISRDDDPGNAIEIVGSSGVNISGNHIIGSIDFSLSPGGQYNYDVHIAGNFHQTSKTPNWGNVLGLAILSDAATGGDAYRAQIPVPFQIGNDARGEITELALQDVIWTPGSIAHGSYASQDIVISGIHSAFAAASVGTSPALPAGVFAFAQFSDVSTAKISVLNMSGSTISLAETTFKVLATR